MVGFRPGQDGKDEMSKEKLERRVRIAEAALWILADKYIKEGCFDRDDKTPTDVVREVRWQAEINMKPNVGSDASACSPIASTGLVGGEG